MTKLNLKLENDMKEKTNGWWSYGDMEDIKKDFLNGKTPKEIAIKRNEDELAITTYLITEHLLLVNAVLNCD